MIELSIVEFQTYFIILKLDDSATEKRKDAISPAQIRLKVVWLDKPWLTLCIHR